MEMELDDEGEVMRQFRLQIQLACRQLRRSSFQQEPNYVAALMGKLCGMELRSGISWLSTSVVNDRGPASAESKFGADFAVILESTLGVKKAVLGQAKGGDIDELPPVKKADFFAQCTKIAARTKHFVGLEAPIEPNTMPTVRRGVWGPPVSVLASTRLDDYLVDTFVACQHGDRRIDFVEAVKKSDLLQLRIMVAQ